MKMVSTWVINWYIWSTQHNPFVKSTFVIVACTAVEMPVLSPPPAAQPPPPLVPPPPPPAAQPAPAMEAAANDNLLHEMIKPYIFESHPFVREEQSGKSARVHSTRQQERMASSSEKEKEEEEEEIRQYLHELKEKAQRELDMHKPSPAIKSFCRKKKWTWMLRRVSIYIGAVAYILYITT